MVRGRSLIFGLILSAAAAATAQLPGFEMPSLKYNPALMMIPAVQKELHVSPQAAQKATQAMATEAQKVFPALMGAMGGKTPNGDQSKQLLVALTRMQDIATKDLTPAQKARLHQITLQSYGPKALLDPQVAAEVGLTPKQESEIKVAIGRIKQSQQKPNMSGGPGASGFDMKGLQDSAKKSRQQSDAALDAILTPKQKLKWKAAQGAHVDLGPLGQMMAG